MSFAKGIVRFGVIAGLAGGALVLIAGPDQAAALFRQTRDEVRGQIDKNIKDPVALRAQLRSLEQEYPKRISSVRGDLAELREQKGQLTRELAVSQRVIELAQADLTQLQDLLSRAESATSPGIETVSYAPAPIVRIMFNNEAMDMPQAYARGTKIQQVLGTYTSRVADINRDMGYLEQQEGRLDSLLTQLENEHTQFQTQIWHLDRQVDSIARNDRMIEMMDKRQRTIDEQSRYRAHSLDQLQGRFAEIRAKQEAQLESFGRVQAGANYEDRAKIDLDARGQWSKPESLGAPTQPSRIIKIAPEAPAPKGPSI